MRKNIVMVSVFAVVVIGFGYFTVFSTPAQDNVNQLANESGEFSAQEITEGSAKEVSISGTDTLQSISEIGRSLECKFTYSNNEVEASAEGTFFTSAGKVRGDFLTESPDMSGKILSSMIINEDMFYVWSEIEGKVYGIKMDFLAMEEYDSSNSAVSMDEPVDYKCEPWENVDNTVFEPPQNVLFQDMTELMNGGMEYGIIYEE
jgi:hypothetical protein